jgi:hypothetical protein
MANGDKFLAEVATPVLLSSLTDLDTLLYRQSIFRDCLGNRAIVREIYDLAVEAIDKEKKHYWGLLMGYPGSILHRSVDVLQMFVEMLKRLRTIARTHRSRFVSEGFTALFDRIEREIDDEFFLTVQDHLKRLKFNGGVFISARLGAANKGEDYVLRWPNAPSGGWLRRIFVGGPPSFVFHLAPRDENGGRALSDLRDRGINLVANALAQSTDHILSFFHMLRTELAFYVGGLNLHEKLSALGEPLAFPDPLSLGSRGFACTGLYDVCLALSMNAKVVGNDVDGRHARMVIITGANRGGKSTFLRSIGLAQLMMQCGLFVPAGAYSSHVYDRLFTHFKREEDTAMKSGKLDEELARMSRIVDRITPNSLVLFNESFAATNEREGSEIARQVVSGLTETGVMVFFVTHLYDFAHGCFARKRRGTRSLRAERQPDGTRTFKVTEAPPLQTSFGEDLYRAVFKSGSGDAGAANAAHLE